MNKSNQEKALPGLSKMIRTLSKKRKKLLALGHSLSHEAYVFDRSLAEENINHFHQSFVRAGISPKIFYAIKSNSHLSLLKTVAKLGHNLDASSERELALALQAMPKEILITGPGKGKGFFEKILTAARKTKITVHLESINELRTLGELAKKRNQIIPCGIRIRTKYQSTWAKFGISLPELKEFLEESKKYPHILLSGFHFHISWMSEPKPVVKTLEALTKFLKKELTDEQRSGISFIDIGGGIVPPETAEGLYPWNKNQRVDFGMIHSIIPKILKDSYTPRYIPSPTTPLNLWGKAIATAWKDIVLPVCPNASLYVEPGRAISHNVMHILMHVMDIKAENIIIVDGGNNMVGWEKHEFFDYTPVYNLSQYAPFNETPTLIYGSLCTPHDLWGFYLRGKKTRIGDIICMPFQGSYTNTLMQDFIRGMPKVIDL